MVEPLEQTPAALVLPREKIVRRLDEEEILVISHDPDAEENDPDRQIGYD